MSDDSLEQWKVEMERYKCELETLKVDTQCSLVLYQQVNMQGQAAMKAALLINGGASVAMLAFIGAAITNSVDSVLLSKLCCSMAVFATGVLSAALASGAAYLAGFLNACCVDSSRDKADSSDEKTFSWWKVWWHVLNGLAIALVVFSYLAFFYGSGNAYCAFTTSLS